MNVPAFLSLDGSLTAEVLPVVLIGVLVIYFAFNLRSLRRRTPQPDNSIDPNQANTEEMLLEAASNLKIDFNLNCLLGFGVGGGVNHRIVSGNRRVVGHVDYEPGHHEPLHIDALATSLNPAGTPLVSQVKQTHKEKFLIVPDIAMSGFDGAFEDYLDEVEAIKRISKALVLSTTGDSYPTGLLAANDQLDDGPIYLRPSTPTAKLIGMIDELQPSKSLDQMEQLQQAIRMHSRRIKGIAVVSSFRRQSSLDLLAELPTHLLQIAVEVTSQWDHHLDLPIKRLFLNDAGQFRTNRLSKDHEEEAKKLQILADRTLAQNPYLGHFKVRRDEPDVAGQLVLAAQG